MPSRRLGLRSKTAWLDLGKDGGLDYFAMISAGLSSWLQ